MKDAIIIGSGPNGFAAAITLAKANLSTLLIEGKDTVGGGMRSLELTLPGFIHDVCSAVHPLAISSPFFQSLPLDVEWVFPPYALAHPFDDGSVAILTRSLDLTAESLGVDGETYKKVMEPLVKNWQELAPTLLAPLGFPKHPLEVFRFALKGFRSAYGFAKGTFKDYRAQSLFGGVAAHSTIPLKRSVTAAFGLILAALAHVKGWPFAKGGSQNIAKALQAIYLSLGGKIETGRWVNNLKELQARLIFCDVTPQQLLKMGDFPQGYKRRLSRFRYGPGVFKMDWALKTPIPWKASECFKAGTLHLGGTLEEIEQSEREIQENKHPEKPFIILAQPSLFDSSRAPHGFHTAWAYCHVPHGSDKDMTLQMENQIERFAPGFKECILQRSSLNPSQLQQYNPNYIGGDINGGVQDIYQLFTRPLAQLNPYATATQGVYLCSSSTPPGGGVHGLCGYHAALSGLKYKIFFDIHE